MKFLKVEWPLAVIFATAGLFLAYGGGWLADLSSGGWFAFVSLWLLAAMFLLVYVLPVLTIGIFSLKFVARPQFGLAFVTKSPMDDYHEQHFHFPPQFCAPSRCRRRSDTC